MEGLLQSINTQIVQPWPKSSHANRSRVVMNLRCETATPPPQQHVTHQDQRQGLQRENAFHLSQSSHGANLFHHLFRCSAKGMGLPKGISLLHVTCRWIVMCEVQGKLWRIWWTADQITIVIQQLY